MAIGGHGTRTNSGKMKKVRPGKLIQLPSYANKGGHYHAVKARSGPNVTGTKMHKGGRYRKFHHGNGGK